MLENREILFWNDCVDENGTAEPSLIELINDAEYSAFEVDTDSINVRDGYLHVRFNFDVDPDEDDAFPIIFVDKERSEYVIGVSFMCEVCLEDICTVSDFNNMTEYAIGNSSFYKCKYSSETTPEEWKEKEEEEEPSDEELFEAWTQEFRNQHYAIPLRNLLFALCDAEYLNKYFEEPQDGKSTDETFKKKVHDEIIKPLFDLPEGHPLREMVEAWHDESITYEADMDYLVKRTAFKAGNK